MPVEKRTISAVEHAYGPGGIKLWSIVQDLDASSPHIQHMPPPPPGGYKWVHVMPLGTPEIRAAEYGIDPTDIDTILDVILHEQFIPEPDTPRGVKAAAVNGAAAEKLRGGKPISLFNASSREEAWAAHRDRIQVAKQSIHVVEGPGRPLDVIRQAHKGSPERQALIQEALAHGRGVQPEPGLGARASSREHPDKKIERERDAALLMERLLKGEW